MEFSLGIDIGGTKTTLGYINENGGLIEYQTFKSLSHNADLFADKLIDEINMFIKQKNIAGIGIATAGRVSFKEKNVVYATNNLKGWDKIQIADLLERKFEIPVYIDNDVNAALLCSLQLNKTLNNSTVIFITIGTGLGGAIAYNGKILRGINGSTGEFGHMILYPDGIFCNCGKRGCAEQYVSGKAYKHFLKKELLKNSLYSSEKDLADIKIQEEIFNGNKIYIKTLNKMSRNLALLLESIKNCIDYNVCILGGSFHVYQELILKEINNSFTAFNHKYHKKPKFIFSNSGNYAGVIGGGLLVFENLLKH